MTVEQRLNGLETAVRRQRIIIAAMILLMVGLVTIAAAPQSRNVEFDFVATRFLENRNDTGEHKVGLGVGENGGYLEVFNKTGEVVVGLHTDEYGNGVVDAYNRKGKGRTLQPGPQ